MQLGEYIMAFSPIQTNHNLNLKNILKTFLDSEKCLMHKQTVEIKVVQINLSEKDIDELILRGQQRLHPTPNS